MKLHKTILLLLMLLSLLTALTACSVTVTKPPQITSPEEEAQSNPDASPSTEEQQEAVEEIFVPEGHYMGVLHQESWYHDGRDITITSLYVSLDAEQYAELVSLLGSVEDICDQGDSTEIQVYSSDDSLRSILSEHVEETIFFSASNVFEAHTIYHRRNIVMDVKTVGVAGHQLSGQGQSIE